jgi:hypothetical protein
VDYYRSNDVVVWWLKNKMVWCLLFLFSKATLLPYIKKRPKSYFCCFSRKEMLLGWCTVEDETKIWQGWQNEHNMTWTNNSCIHGLSEIRPNKTIAPALAAAPFHYYHLLYQGHETLRTCFRVWYYIYTIIQSLCSVRVLAPTMVGKKGKKEKIIRRYLALN